MHPRVSLAAALLSLVAPVVVFAQVSIPGIENTLTLSSIPQYPGPNSAITLTLSDSFIDISSSNITWYVSGKEVASGVGLTSYKTSVGGLGSETDVVATADTDQGELSTSATLTPTSIDLVWESDSYTPAFYLGRALPSAGSRVRVEAIPHFLKSDGSEVPANSLLYTWRVNGTVVGTQSGTGHSFALMSVSPFAREESIEVEIASPDGHYSGTASVSIPVVQPLLELYEDHPLLGILFTKALGTSASIPEPEMAFAAVPYFTPIFAPNDPSLSYSWAVNDQTIPTDSKAPSEITINAQNSTGAASLSVALSQLSNVFLDINGAWNLLFSTGASRSNPFTNPGKSH